MSGFRQCPSDTPGASEVPVHRSRGPAGALPLHRGASEQVAVAPLLDLHEVIALEVEVADGVAGQPVPDRPTLGDAIPRRGLEVRGPEETCHGPEEGRTRELHVLDGFPAGHPVTGQRDRRARLPGGEEVQPNAVRRIVPARPHSPDVSSLVGVGPVEPKKCRGVPLRPGRRLQLSCRVGGVLQGRPLVEGGRASQRPEEHRSSRKEGRETPHRSPPVPPEPGPGRRASRTSSGRRRGRPDPSTQTSSVRTRARSSSSGIRRTR